MFEVPLGWEAIELPMFCPITNAEITAATTVIIAMYLFNTPNRQSYALIKMSAGQIQKVPLWYQMEHHKTITRLIV